jgi:hypothetical protein
MFKGDWSKYVAKSATDVVVQCHCIVGSHGALSIVLVKISAAPHPIRRYCTHGKAKKIGIGL